MKLHCGYCNKDINTRIDNNYIWFSYGKGILCKECYQFYDLEIKSIEEKYKVGRGFLKKEAPPNE